MTFKTIKKKTIDKNYFIKEIDVFMTNERIFMTHVINITEDNGWTTLWYWG